MPFQTEPISTVGIVGLGAFGVLMARHLAAHVQIVAHDPARVEAAPVTGVRMADAATVAQCDVVVLAVPVDQIKTAIVAIKPHLRPGTIILDVGSVKIEPVRVMIEELPPFVEIIGTHPLFGPQSARHGIAGHRLAWCPVRVSERGHGVRRIAAFLRHVLKLDVIHTTADEHDRQMAVVQGLTHLIAKVLVRMEPLPTTMTTTSFDLIMRATDMVRHDSPAVYEAIERANPHSAAVRDRFFALAEEVRGTLEAPSQMPSSQSVLDGDVDLLAQQKEGCRQGNPPLNSPYL